MNLIRRHPALVYGTVGAALWALVALADVQYDDGGISSALWWAARLFSLPYSLVQEAIFFFSREEILFQTTIVVLGGLGLCMTADAIIRLVRSKV